jgi:hypothetical protein
MASHELSSASPPERRFPQWKLEYETALLETDPKALFKRIEVAEAAILTRREELILSSNGLAERQEIKMALGILRRLKKERLHFS